MANTDEILKAIAETAEEYAVKPENDEVFDIAPRNVIFAAQKALEARDLLRQAAKCVKGICALTGADVSKVPLIQKINEVLEN
jgi:hypothetical protein